MVRERAESAVPAEFVAFRNFRQVRVAQEVCSVVDANQVMAFALRKIAHSRDFVVVAVLLKERLFAIVNNQVVGRLRVNRLKFVI